MDKISTKKDCAIFISSCDSYSDAWEPFFTLFFKYWPDCPFPIYLISTTKKYNDSRVNMINFPNLKDTNWAERIKNSLQIYPYKYIIYFQEDYFLTKSVNTEKILSLLDLMREENAAYLRLYPSPGPDKKFKKYNGVGEINDNSEYRTSLQVAIWDSAVLNKMLWGGELLWDFELIHTEKISQPFLSVKREMSFPYFSESPVKYIATGIQKGKWNIAVLRLFKKENITIKSDRLVESKAYWQYFLLSLPVIGKIFKQFYRIKYKIKTIFGF